MAEVVANLAKLGEATIRELEARLQRIKEERIREAEALGIGEKVRLIVDVYGECDSYGCTCWFDTKIQGRKARLVSNCVHGEHVFIEGKAVYDEIDHKPSTYIPGPWVTAIINLYEAAKLRKAKEELEWKIRQLEEEAAKWGVRLEDLICPTCSDDEAPF